MSLPEGARLVRLTEDHELKPFDCGDEKGDLDLNEFFHKDSKPSIRELATVTQIIECDTETIAFYSLLNDKISVADGLSHRQFETLRESKFEEVNWSKSFPCVKLARLGVHKKYQRRGIGDFIIDSIRQSFIDNNKTGCRFITVDAYNREGTLNFYLKNNFKYLPQKEEKENAPTRLMYYDLLSIR